MVVKKKSAPKKKTTATKAKQAKGKTISLPPVLDITCAAAFCDDLKKIAAPGAKITIDAKKLEKITTPGVQLLLAAHNTVTSKKGSMAVKNISNEVIENLSILGLNSQLNEWK